MASNLASRFNEVANEVVQYHSYFASLMSGIIIGMLTNYVITYFLPLTSVIGLLINITLLIISSYVVMSYSPDIHRKGISCDIPESLSVFITQHFTAFLVFIRVDLEYYAFKDDFPSFNHFNIKENVAVEGMKDEYRYHWQMVITYSFLKLFKCKLFLNIKPLDYRGKSSLRIELEFNRYARFHPKTDKILKTIGSRISLAVYNPQLIYPEITDKEFKKIIDDIYMREK